MTKAKRHIITDAERGHRPKTLAGNEERYTLLLDPYTKSWCKGKSERVKAILRRFAALEKIMAALEKRNAKLQK
jgi:hypothetical protein